MTRALAAGVTLLWGAAAAAHPLAPALLELTEVSAERYAVHWRTSVARAGSARVEPRLPPECASQSQPEPRIESGEALVARWVVSCAGGLGGRTLAVDGLDASGINVIVRVAGLDAPEFKALLGADQPAVTVAPAAGAVFPRYLRLGAEHLLAGVDHLLFLLGLFLLVTGARALLVTITAFTAGHSVTLALATLGWVPVRQDVAELVIAATVLALALDLLRGRSVSWFGRRPWLMAGGFGLIHGLGFAGALRGIGLPAQDLPLALLGFNVGIELAQLALVAVLMLAALTLGRRPLPRFAALAPAYVTGSLAVCWLLERSVVLLA